MNPQEYVTWFHSKIANRLGGRWPEMMFDHAALATLIDKYNIESVFEIGTWEGLTALFMWLHPRIIRLKTIDICVAYGHEYHKPENGIYAYHLQGTKAQFQIVSSLEYVPTEGEQWDMVFVEGNHAYEYVKNDYWLAKKMNPKIIAFHDVSNGNAGVDKFIGELMATPEEKARLVIVGNGSCMGYYINQ